MFFPASYDIFYYYFTPYEFFTPLYKEEEFVDSVSRNWESESVLSGSHTGKSVLTL